MFAQDFGSCDRFYTSEISNNTKGTCQRPSVVHTFLVST